MRGCGSWFARRSPASLPCAGARQTCSRRPTPPRRPPGCAAAAVCPSAGAADACLITQNRPRGGYVWCAAAQASHGMHKGSPEARRRMCACRGESLLHACSGKFRACDGRVVAPQVKRRKKAMMRMRLDVFVSAQPEEEQEAGFHSGSQAWGRQPAWAQPQVTGPCTMQATPDGTMHRSSRIPAPYYLAPESGPRPDSGLGSGFRPRIATGAVRDMLGASRT